jgi:hypothetical protein
VGLSSFLANGGATMILKSDDDELTDAELLLFIKDFSRELIAMARERKLYSLVQPLRSTETASRSILATIGKR